MSVINQVLNKLEQRGARSAIVQDMVRPVPQTRGAGKLKIAGLSTLGGAALAVLVWQWFPVSHPVAAVKGEVTGRVATRPAPSAISAVASAATGKPETGGPQADALRGSESINSSTVKDLRTRPMIASVSPDPIFVSAAAQPLVIKGGGYSKETTVTLRNSGGKIYANRPIISQSETQIILNAKLGKAPDSWTVELLDARGISSGAYPFTVHASPAPRSAAKAAVAAANGAQDKPMKHVSRTQQADAEYHKAAGLMLQGQQAAALKGFEEALSLDAGHDAARQALAALLLKEKRGDEAEQVLRDGLKNKPEHNGLAMLLARVQVERGALERAVATLEKNLPHAEAQADFQAFYAALLQRQKRHKDAIAHYQIALQQVPNNGAWLMGCGISLQAEHRDADAKYIYQRAIDSETLSAELQAFVRQKLKEL